jgi:adenylate cyclase
MEPEPSADDQERSEMWRLALTGEDPYLPKLRRGWMRIPNGPRCKMCAAPFHGIGRIVTKFVMHGPSEKNPLLCNLCFGKLREHVGGADIDVSILFADVRGSTGLAERLGTGAFRAHLQRFYGLAHRAVEDRDGLVDKFLGDGVMALFLPVLTGDDHPGRAIAAARALIEAVERSELAAAGIRIGAGVHTGTAFVGVIGGEGRTDFTALGDTVNVAARLGGAAKAGELIVSASAWDRQPRDLVASDRRSITVQGRSEPLEVVALQLGDRASVAA